METAPERPIRRRGWLRLPQPFTEGTPRRPFGQHGRLREGPPAGGAATRDSPGSAARGELGSEHDAVLSGHSCARPALLRPSPLLPWPLWRRDIQDGLGDPVSGAGRGGTVDARSKPLARCRSRPQPNGDPLTPFCRPALRSILSGHTDSRHSGQNKAKEISRADPRLSPSPAVALRFRRRPCLPVVLLFTPGAFPGLCGK